MTAAIALSLFATRDSGSAAAQLLTNGDFASDATSWTQAGTAVAPTVVWTNTQGNSPGSYSANINDTSSATIVLSQCVPATAARSYTATGDALIPTATQDPATATNITLTWFAAANCSGGSLSADASASVTQSAGWQPMSVTATAPATTAGVRFDFVLTGKNPDVSNDAYGYFDNAVLGTNQTISFTQAGVTYGDAPFVLGGTASSGLTVSYASSTQSVCTVLVDTVTIVTAGNCTITASQAGNAGTWNAAADVPVTFAIAKKSQTITFGALGGKTFGNAPFGVSATSDSSLTVAFTSDTTGTCTVSGTTVTIVAAGTCTVRAAQAGNGNYNAATDVTQGFTIAQASQTITFGALAGKRMEHHRQYVHGLRHHRHARRRRHLHRARRPGRQR